MSNPAILLNLALSSFEKRKDNYLRGLVTIVNGGTGNQHIIYPSPKPRCHKRFWGSPETRFLLTQ